MSCLISVCLVWDAAEEVNRSNHRNEPFFLPHWESLCSKSISQVWKLIKTFECCFFSCVDLFLFAHRFYLFSTLFCFFWKNRICFCFLLLLLWPVRGLFIVRVNISWPSRLIHRTTVSHCCSQTTWINEKRQQQRPTVFPQQVDPDLCVLQVVADWQVVWWCQLLNSLF